MHTRFGAGWSPDTTLNARGMEWSFPPRDAGFATSPGATGEWRRQHLLQHVVDISSANTMRAAEAEPLLGDPSVSALSKHSNDAAAASASCERFGSPDVCAGARALLLTGAADVADETRMSRGEPGSGFPSELVSLWLLVRRRFGCEGCEALSVAAFSGLVRRFLPPLPVSRESVSLIVTRAASCGPRDGANSVLRGQQVHADESKL